MEIDKEDFIVECAKNSSAFHSLKITIKVKEHREIVRKYCNVLYNLDFEGEKLTLKMGERNYDNDDKDYGKEIEVESKNLEDMLRERKEITSIDGKNGKYKIKAKGDVRVPKRLNYKEVWELFNFFGIKGIERIAYYIAEEESRDEHVKPHKHRYGTEKVISRLDNMKKKNRVPPCYSYAGIRCLKK